MKIGLVCPYSFDVRGGVQSHIVDLAEALQRLGHSVSVLAPAKESTIASLPPFVVPAGRSVPIRYNGSVARLAFGPRTYNRVRRWLIEGEFDVVHVHEPAAPSLSLLTVMLCQRPLVATFHTANPRSRMLATFSGVLQPLMEKISGRIAVSPLARQMQLDYMNGDAVIIPNGVNVAAFADADPLPGYPRPGGTIGFIGRFGEQRKGMQVLLPAFADLLGQFPDAELLIIGDGDQRELLRQAGPSVARHIRILGQVNDETKARMLRSVDVYCAPNVRGESFGIILTEAMSAGAAVVASDLPAFVRVLSGGAAGLLAAVGDADQLSHQLATLLSDTSLRRQHINHARQVVEAFDWSTVAAQVVQVYETVLDADPDQVLPPEFDYPTDYEDTSLSGFGGDHAVRKLK